MTARGVKRGALDAVLLVCTLGCLQPSAWPQPRPSSQTQLRQHLATGWNTWYSPNVLSHVRLPEGFGIELQFKQHYWLEEKFLRRAIIGRETPRVRPGHHAMDGSYTELTLEWETLTAKVESAHLADNQLAILVTPVATPGSPVTLVTAPAIYWNDWGLCAQ